jgi:RNA polymerase sigma-70 factor (ECF subfamily)
VGWQDGADSPNMTPGANVTGLLKAWSGGDLAARDQLVEVLYHELRRRAAARLRAERAGHVLQATALVHEAYLRLVDQKRAVWQNRAQFLGVASEMMRRILVDHARRRKMAKRSGQWAKVTITDALAGSGAPSIDVLNLDQAMGRLAEFDARKSHIAELRFFGGLSLEETSSVLNLSVATVERDWQAARAWLYAQMNGTKSDAGG